MIEKDKEYMYKKHNITKYKQTSYSCKAVKWQGNRTVAVYQDMGGQVGYKHSTEIWSTTFCWRTLILTLVFVGCSYDPQYIHVDLCILRVLLSHPPPHSEEEVAGGEAVAAERVTERVLRPETQFKAPVGMSERLWEQQELQTGVRLEQLILSSDGDNVTKG